MTTTLKKMFAILLAMFLLATVFSCSKNEEESEFSEEEDAEEMVQAVRVESLVPSDLRKFIELNGNVRAEKSMSVYPIMAGKIAGTNVRLGSIMQRRAVARFSLRRRAAATIRNGASRRWN